MKYIADTLGIEVNTEPWDSVDKLPYFLFDRYEFMKATIGGVPCLFIKPKGELDALTAIKKHILRVREIEQLPVIVVIESMTARRRKSLIGAHIPFVAPAYQIYLPFLGIALSERYTSPTTPRETLMPSSQLLLFHYLYHTEPELRTGETAEVFGISAMQISRSIKQLTALELVLARKEGVRTIIYSNERHHDLFDKAKPYLLNPVRKRLYVDYEELPVGLPLSGYSALSEMTMLGSPTTKTFALYGKTAELSGTEALVDNTEQVEVEIWRYNPVTLSRDPNVVDALSLAASLAHEDDPRIEQSLDELLSKVWR